MVAQNESTLFGTVRVARFRAALKGDFDPRELALQVGAASDPTEVLIELAKDCYYRAVGSAVRWSMRPDSRRAVLASARPDQLEAAARSVNLATADPFERSMARLVLRKPVLNTFMPPAELDALRTAAQFMGDLTEDGDVLVAEIDVRVGRAAVDDAIAFAAPRRLVGRHLEEQRLRRYISNGLPVSRDGRPPALLLAGIGGAGKSALLASFIRGARRRNWTGHPVVWFDFDRALLAEVDQATLLLEFSRQLGLAIPGLAGPLSEFRRLARERPMFSGGAEQSFESTASAQSELWSLWGGVLREHLPVRERVVLVFDTFEEVLLRSDSEVRELLRFVDALATEGSVPNLRPIYSGREVEADVTRELAERAVDHIRLRDLSRSAARELLRRQLAANVAKPESYPLDLLVRTFGGNPLIIRLIAQFCCESDPNEVRVALGDAQAAGLARQFAHSFLYTRILKRIRSNDPDVRKLAHPGLTLRRVSPALIRQVLAEPCGIEDMDDRRSEQLFDELAKQVWLVERLPEKRAIRHRRDLRRLMLLAISEEDSHRVREIHERASAFYARRSDPDMPADQQWNEALYHNLLIRDVNLDPEAATSLVRALGEDVNDIPIERRARLKVLAEAPLDALEYRTLSDPARKQEDLRSARFAQRRGETPVLSSTDGLASSVRVRPGDLEYLVGEALVSARTDQLVGLVDLAWKDLVRSFRVSSRATFAITPMWRMALAGLVDQQVQSAILDRLSHVQSHELQTNTRFAERPRAFVTADALACIIVLLGGHIPGWLEHWWARDLPETVASLDELRRVQLQRIGSSSGGTNPYRVNGELLTLPPGSQRTLLAADQLGTARFGPTLARMKTLANVNGQMVSPWAFAAGSREPIPAVFPEIYPLVRALLQQAPDHQIAALTERFQSEQPLWPMELRYWKLSAAMARDRPRWIATLVETADRLGLMDQLVDAACLHAEHGEPAHLLRGIWFEWQRLMKFVVS